MKIDAISPINSLPPVTLTDTALSDRSTIAVGPDAVGKNGAIPNGQDQLQSERLLQGNIDRLNQGLQQENMDVSFSVDPSTKRVVVKVVNQQKNEIVYQFPTDEALRVTASLEYFTGKILNRKA